MIGQKFNYDEVFFRDLTICVLDTLEGRLNWINRFTSGDVNVEVPIYYSLTGDERFLLDSFQDDIVSENRYVELNTDQIPRGHLTMTTFNIRSDEFRNPNVWLRSVVENETEVKRLLKQVRAIPITVNYDLTILLKNEIDIFKCSQEIMNTLWLYRFIYFEHNYMNIDAVITVPDSETIEISREKNLTSDNTVKLTLALEVQTYYPAFTSTKDCRILTNGILTTGSNIIKVGPIFTSSCKRDNISINDILSGYQVIGSGIPNGVYVTLVDSVNSEIVLNKNIGFDFIGDISFSSETEGSIIPYRTRWFNNLIYLSGKNGKTSNPNAGGEGLN
jgi:hypothetical protein